MLDQFGQDGRSNDDFCYQMVKSPYEDRTEEWSPIKCSFNHSFADPYGASPDLAIFQIRYSSIVILSDYTKICV